MGFRRTIALGLGLLVLWLLGISILRRNLGTSIRLFNDDGDRSIYAADGSWFLNGQVPYRDTLSEYPQIPTYLFALPYLFVHPQPGTDFSYWLYSSVISLVMLGFLFGTIVVLYQMLPEHKNRAYLMLLPASLYFAYNRFDILPSFLVLLCLFFLQRQKNILAGFVLGVAALTKWYPALLLPVFLSYTYHTQGRIDWKMILAFGSACLIILAPTFLSGGIKAVLVPYLLHAQRGFEYVSLPALLHTSFENWFGVGLNTTVLTYLFLILSVLPVPLSLFARIDSFEKVVYWSALVVAFFVLFARIWSPQWILWLLPLLILIARTPMDIAGIVAYGIVNYLAFPVIFDSVGPDSWQLKVAGLVGFSLLGYFAVILYRRAEGGLSQLLVLLRSSKSKV